MTIVRHTSYVRRMATKLDVLTTAEAAEALGVHLRTVHRWVDTGRITPVTKLPGIRGAYLFERADIEALTTQAETAS